MIFTSTRTLGVFAALIAAAALATAAPAFAGPAGALRPWRGTIDHATPVTTLAPPNDTCAGAITIGCGPFNLSGDTSTANNDYTFPSDVSSCTGFVENGRDVVYKMTVQSGDSVWVDYSSTQIDCAIYIVTDCSNPSGTCVVGEDSTDVGGSESLRWKFTAAGTYYLILDAFGDNAGGTWTAIGQLFSSQCPPPPSNDTCALPVIIGCGAFSYSGSTDLANNDYQFPDAASSCFNSRAQGKDVVYRITVDAGDSLWVNYNSSSDGAIYLVADCSDVVGSCVTGADNTGTGQTEALRYRFNFGGTYYVILDSKALNSSGSYTLVGEHVCPSPPKNDICEMADGIAHGPFSLSGNTKLAADNYSFDTDAESCTGFRTAGNDVVYWMYAHAQDTLHVSYTSSADGALYLVRDCGNLAATCVAGADNNAAPGATEQLDHVFTQEGKYYLILDSFGAGSFGAWTATGRLGYKVVGVEDLGPGPLALAPASPNPFRSATTLRFTLPRAGNVSLRLVDLQGRVVRTLADGAFPAGAGERRWDGRDDHGQLVNAGVYFVKLRTDAGELLGRTVFVR